MPRPKRIRKMINPPHFKGFRPIGAADDTQSVLLNFEEYEAIRLCDYELLSQLEASQVMEVSRPTFTRVYESARRKVAQAFVLGKAIVFEGGKVRFDNEWFRCNKCESTFNCHNDADSLPPCPLCGATHIEPCVIQQTNL